jgi:putative ABC transport system permease protein
MILASFLIGATVAYIIMRKWLEGYAYKAEPDFLTFALAFIILLSFSVFAVNLVSVRAARTNPVDSLRCE